MISPSKLALHAAGFERASEYALKENAQCVMCGVRMLEGDQAAAWEPTIGFTNFVHLLAPTSKHVCPDCAGAWRVEFTQSWATGVIFNEDGVHKANSADTMAHALLYPPMTPFLWVKGDQKQQHLVWRTPVTIDKNLVRVRLGEKVVTIRRLVVIGALKAFRDAEEVLKSIPKELRPAKKANPGNESGLFRYLAWDVDHVDHSLISDGLIALSVGHKHAQQFSCLKDLLQSLNFGEVWALMILLKSKKPTKPEIIATPKSI
jgi:CRISPR type IV-associated protein Csf1